MFIGRFSTYFHNGTSVNPMKCIILFGGACSPVGQVRPKFLVLTNYRSGCVPPPPGAKHLPFMYMHTDCAHAHAQSQALVQNFEL